MRKLFIGLLLVSQFLKAQEQAIPFLKASIKVDGNLNESVWDKSKVFTGFHNFFPYDQGKAQNKTKVSVFHDGENLYIGAIYFDTTPANRVSTLKRDGHGDVVVGSDAFGIVIDTYNKKNNGYYFAINARNAQMDALVNFNGTGYRYNESWNSVWKSKTSTDGTKKIYEVVIPFKSLSLDANNDTWGIQFFIRDSKINLWMTYTDLSRNFIQFDLRFTENVKIENLPKVNATKYVMTPSITYDYQNDVSNKGASKSKLKPSLDTQYRLTPSLKLDATINPDFSQIDVDRQVTNLTRFAINFPERRNFFIENSDLFTGLGTNDVNPFYSRRIGASSDILFGLKLSGNIAPKTRIGVLNVQTDKGKNNTPQNYGALVLQQQFAKELTTTGFLVNRQLTKGVNFQNNFNRVGGLNVNYKSKNNKWTSLANLGKSFSENTLDKNYFYNLGLNYSTKKVSGAVSASKVGQNYLTDIGFVPRLYNYDAVSNKRIREGYSTINSELTLNHFPKTPKIIQIRYLRAGSKMYFNQGGDVSEIASFTNHAIFFQNTSSAYISLGHRYVNLKYGFDPLQNGNYLKPNIYNFSDMRIGYYSPNTKNFTYEAALTYGDYFNGDKSRLYLQSSYRFLPLMKLGLRYTVNYLDLKELGEKTFHLVRFTGEVFFNNRLNWTTYLQYNTQQNNFNINSRLQWEYKPLSYIYLVVTDNYSEQLNRKNWGVALKLNYRLDF